MKRLRESSSTNQEDFSLLTEVKVSSAKKRKVGVAACRSKLPRARERVRFNNNRTFNAFDEQ